MGNETGDSNKHFWGRYARFYDFEINLFNRSAYEQMYHLMGSALSGDMKVLELATGTGLIACNVAQYVTSIHATDFSPKMIAAARKKRALDNVTFSVEDVMALSFEGDAFDAAIISNALHIIPDPKQALSEIRRVLKPSGLLIAPTFSHGHLSDSTWSLNASLLKRIGFETYSKWTPEEYVSFIGDNGFAVMRWQVLKAGFPLVYVEARKEE
jgi:ubiquinone/menaquinone biosynthesis C-methylase UbiE